MMIKTTAPYRKILLAYSGGLDTTTIIPWLKEHYPQAEIVAYCANVGQLTAEETEAMQHRAIATGASKLLVEDLTAVFLTDYVYPTLKAHAIYEQDYLLGTSMARPLIGKRLAEVAVAEHADAICHGATGKGNDQVRFELAFKAFAPHLPIIAPWRLWDIASRTDAMNYLEARGIHLPFRIEQSYSRDENIWHLSHEGLELEDPAIAPNYKHLLQLTTVLEATPDTPEEVSITFEQGIPTAVNGQVLAPVTLMKTLNALGSKHGIGLVDIVENRLVGMKSRGVYETPGGTLLYQAHAQLEHLCLDRATYAYKQQIALQFAQITYNGDWFSPLREALSAFVDSTQQVVCGNVKLKLYKGNVIPAGTTSPFSLYDEDLASFATGDLFNHADAAGFINLYGLSTQVRALKAQKRQTLVSV
jgi:argininosuccinate synthase